MFQEKVFFGFLKKAFCTNKGEQVIAKSRGNFSDPFSFFTASLAKSRKLFFGVPFCFSLPLPLNMRKKVYDTSA